MHAFSLLDLRIYILCNDTHDAPSFVIFFTGILYSSTYYKCVYLAYVHSRTHIFTLDNKYIGKHLEKVALANWGAKTKASEFNDHRK